MPEINSVSYRIKEAGKPGSKPRVFVAAHPQDQPVYLDRITEKLQEQVDCIVYYFDDPGLTCSEKVLSDTLDDMQLVAVPVTRLLLMKPCEAMDRIIPYAMDHNIPVLPLLMEEDAAGSYKRKFGDLQYLIPDDPDKTAVPFEQKLAGYLSEVLVSEDTAQRVRDAFDATVFLSYRKKDRTYARELMKMIHRNPRCRDIAFWYDEFLVPGEDFNEGISRALSGSDLFTMVVTPSLLEDPNFVMTHEYPAAKDSGKEIFPVEMKETDRVELADCYEDIPPCVSGNGDAEWDEALMERMKRFALRTRQDDPEHTFLIGLAYLDGINMEVDQKKGVELITEAANAGLEEAMRKLTLMYINGKGVPRSYAKAYDWRKALTDHMWDRYNENENDDLYDELYIEINKLSSLCYKLKKEVQTMSLLHDLEWMSHSRIEKGRPGALHDLAVCLSKRGDIMLALQDKFSAERYQRESVELFTQLLEKEDTDEARRDLYIAERTLAMIMREIREYDQTLELLGHCLELLSGLKEEAYRTLLRRDLAGIHRLRGDILDSMDRNEEAESEYMECFRILEEIAPEKMSFRDRSVLANTCNSLSWFYRKKGNTELSSGYLNKQIRILELQIEEAREKEMSHADLFRIMGSCYESKGCPEDAEKSYIAALEAPEPDPDSPEVLDERLRVFGCLVSLTERMRKLPENVRYRGEEIDLARRLYKETNEPKYLETLADSLHKNAERILQERPGMSVPYALEEELITRLKLANRHLITRNEINFESLRYKIDGFYKNHPELRLYRIVVHADMKTEPRVHTALYNAGFIAYETREVECGDLEKVVGKLNPDLIVIEENVCGRYFSEYLTSNEIRAALNHGTCRGLLVITDNPRELRTILDPVTRKSGKVNTISRPFTKDQLIRKVREMLT